MFAFTRRSAILLALLATGSFCDARQPTADSLSEDAAKGAQYLMENGAASPFAQHQQMLEQERRDSVRPVQPLPLDARQTAVNALAQADAGSVYQSSGIRDQQFRLAQFQQPLNSPASGTTNRMTRNDAADRGGQSGTQFIPANPNAAMTPAPPLTAPNLPDINSTRTNDSGYGSSYGNNRDQNSLYGNNRDQNSLYTNPAGGDAGLNNSTAGGDTTAEDEYRRRYGTQPPGTAIPSTTPYRSVPEYELPNARATVRREVATTTIPDRTNPGTNYSYNNSSADPNYRVTTTPQTTTTQPIYGTSPQYGASPQYGTSPQYGATTAPPYGTTASNTGNGYPRGPMSETNTGYSTTTNRQSVAPVRPSSSLLILTLFGSIGLNMYLGWIAWDHYNRYQEMVSDMRQLKPRRSRRESDTTGYSERLADSAAY